MEAPRFSSAYGTPIEIDVCWPCQSIWFDHMESVSLSPQSVIDLFRRIHDARDQARNTLSMRCNCPRCSEALAYTQDTAKGGHFAYQRCPRGDGRLISFTQFLHEKSFLRTLNPAEVSALSVTVKQLRCSSCGAPINLEKDTACSHCGAAVSVLDEQAVDKTLKEYEARAAQQGRVSTAQAAAASPVVIGNTSSAGADVGDLINTIVAVEAGSVLVDLVAAGISSLFD